MADSFLSLKDFWRVSGYSYPNPFSENKHSREAWDVFVSFFEFVSYAALKAYWKQGQKGRKLSRQAVESWKATFEEFGLCYVLSGVDEIKITPAGQQFFDAGSNGNKAELEWIGLNLLLRYPLRGGRKPKSPTHATSNVFPYQYFYAVLLECEGFIYWTELERILSKVFRVSDAKNAVSTILDLRLNPEYFSKFDLPSDQSAGALYNSLNQFLIHAAMGYTILDKSKNSIYPAGERAIQISISPDKRSMIIDALSSSVGSTKSFIDHLSFSTPYPTQQEYFNALGSKVSKRGIASAPVPAPAPTKLKTETANSSSEILIKTSTSFEPSQKKKKQTKSTASNGKINPSTAKPKSKPKRKSKLAKVIGDRGEEIVMKHEREKLIAIGREDLANQIVHEARNNNTPGWDITSFNENGDKIYIEVKATVGGKMSSFTLTSNELAAARNPEFRESYCIYLVFEAMSPKGARIEIIENPYAMIKNSELGISLEAVSIAL